MTNKVILSSDDVGLLMKDPSPENRAIAAKKVCETFSGGDIGSTERALIEDIFKIMVRDTEEMVRLSLSESLKDDPSVPHDVARALASDVASVALPMIEYSQALSDEDLVEIVARNTADHQIAVARRESVSATVSDALANTHNEDVVAALVSNDGAEIDEETFTQVLNEFGTSEKVNTPMAMRKELPLKVSERLVSLVSDKMREHLVTHHALSADMATDLVLQAREKAIISMLHPEKSAKDVIELVDELHRHKRLTPTIVMRALCMGDVTFFEAALAKLGDVSVKNVYRLVHDQGDLGLKALFEKCKLSPTMLEVARTALRIAEGLQLNNGEDRAHFQQLMIERVLTQFEEDFDTDNLDYFITKLGAENPTHQAA